MTLEIGKAVKAIENLRAGWGNQQDVAVVGEALLAIEKDPHLFAELRGGYEEKNPHVRGTDDLLGHPSVLALFVQEHAKQAWLPKTSPMAARIALLAKDPVTLPAKELVVALQSIVTQWFGKEELALLEKHIGTVLTDPAGLAALQGANVDKRGRPVMRERLDGNLEDVAGKIEQLFANLLKECTNPETKPKVKAIVAEIERAAASRV